MEPKLTIGMATYDDFSGVFFSIQAIRLYHKEILDNLEFIIIDNNPGEDHSNSICNFVSQIENHVPIRHILAGDWKSTAVRDLVFQEATTPYVLCMDSHVLLEPGSLEKLLQYYKQYPDTDNLLQGPMIYDDLKTPITHMDPVWRAHMYGIWATDDRGLMPDQSPFEIPMHGMGLFTCRKAAWLGFNKRFRGFGGEEGYIHEKYRRAGHKTICLPFLRWNHRFERPGGPKYNLSLEDRIRNYFIGFIENKMDVSPVISHFSEILDSSIIQDIYNDAINKKDKSYTKPLDVEQVSDNQINQPFPPRTDGTLCYGSTVPDRIIGTVQIDGVTHNVFGAGAHKDCIKLIPHDHSIGISFK
tara:strand:- start:657 stop:1727 length:1071 start_codon:yes stop_codon:yes gene_type:complete